MLFLSPITIRGINYQTIPVPDNSCKIFAGVKTGEYPFEHWNAPPSTYDEVNKGVSTLLASQHRMGWHNWCAGEPNSGSSSSCNIFYGEKFSSDNYCWYVIIQWAILKVNHYHPVLEPGMISTARTNGATCVKSPSVRVTYLSKILIFMLGNCAIHCFSSSEIRMDSGLFA